MVHDAVYHGRGHLVVPEDRKAPPGELEAGVNTTTALRLVGLGRPPGRQPRPVGVEQEEAQLVYDQELGPAELWANSRSSLPSSRARRRHLRARKLRRRAWRAVPAGERARRRLRHVRLARADVAHELGGCRDRPGRARQVVHSRSRRATPVCPPLVAVELLARGSARRLRRFACASTPPARALGSGAAARYSTAWARPHPHSAKTRTS